MADSSSVCSQREKQQKNETEDSYQMKHDWKTLVVSVVNGNKHGLSKDIDFVISIKYMQM